MPLVRDNNGVISVNQTLKEWPRDIPGDPVVKNPPAKAGDIQTWSGWIPHAAEKLSPCATITEPMSCNY